MFFWSIFTKKFLTKSFGGLFAVPITFGEISPDSGDFPQILGFSETEIPRFWGKSFGGLSPESGD